MALNKEIINEIGQATRYHRIKCIECDFDSNKLHIFLENYTSQEYRNIQKQEKRNLDIMIEGIKENNEIAEDVKINLLQPLECKTIQSRGVSTIKYTIELDDIFRKGIYKRIMKEIPDFKEAEMI